MTCQIGSSPYLRLCLPMIKLWEHFSTGIVIYQVNLTNHAGLGCVFTFWIDVNTFEDFEWKMIEWHFNLVIFVI